MQRDRRDALRGGELMDLGQVLCETLELEVYRMGQIGGAVFRRLTFEELKILPWFGATLFREWQN